MNHSRASRRIRRVIDAEMPAQQSLDYGVLFYPAAGDTVTMMAFERNDHVGAVITVPEHRAAEFHQILKDAVERWRQADYPALRRVEASTLEFKP